MHEIVTNLVLAIYSEPRAGRPMPLRIELGADTFARFQAEHREMLADLLPEAGNVYPGSLVGVPIVEVATPGAALVSGSGERRALDLE